MKRYRWLETPVRCLLAVVAVVAVGVASGGVSGTQLENNPAERAIRAAIDALGGQKFLGVTSLVSEGVFTPFSQGQRGLPINFHDTVVFPDRNRTEFGKKKKERLIQSNTWESGWKYDGPREVLAPQSEDEIKAYRRYVRANIDNILRRYWDDPGVLLRHRGRVEYAPRKWAEVVEVEYPDGLLVEVFFDPQTHLPVATKYREGSESGAPGSVVETRYYAPYLEFGGVKFPRTIDLFRDQVQTARIVYEEVDLNSRVDPTYFEQPADKKSIN